MRQQEPGGEVRRGGRWAGAGKPMAKREVRLGVAGSRAGLHLLCCPQGLAAHSGVRTQTRTWDTAPGAAPHTLIHRMGHTPGPQRWGDDGGCGDAHTGPLFLLRARQRPQARELGGGS